MTLIRSTNRKEAYDSIINLALKDPTRYCNYCGSDFNPDDFPCCEDPQVGTNKDHARAVAKECKRVKDECQNDHASFANNSMRLGVKFPVFMYEMLDRYEKKHGRKLINDDKDIMWLAKNYPQFAVPRKL